MRTDGKVVVAIAALGAALREAASGGVAARRRYAVTAGLLLLMTACSVQIVPIGMPELPAEGPAEPAPGAGGPAGDPPGAEAPVAEPPAAGPPELVSDPTPIEAAEWSDPAWIRRIAPVLPKGPAVEDVAVLSDGSFAVTGRVAGRIVFGRDGPNETVLQAGSGLYDPVPFLARFDSDGALLWARLIGGNLAKGVVALPDGSIVVHGVLFSERERERGDPDAATTFGRGEPGETRVGDCDGVFDHHRRIYTDRYDQPVDEDWRLDCQALFLARYAPEGELLWVRTASGMGTVEGLDIAAVADSSVAVTGSLRGMALFGEGDASETVLATEDNVPQNVRMRPHDSFLARFGADGSLEWATMDAGAAVTGLPDGAVAAAGTSEDETFVSRYGADGQRRWTRRIAGTGQERGRHLAKLTALDDGSIVTAGFVPEPDRGRRTRHIFLARHDARGELLWTTRLTDNDATDHLRGLAPIPDGSFVLAGMTGDGSEIFGRGQVAQVAEKPGGGANVSVLARFDADGHLREARNPAGTESGNLRAISPANDGTLVLAGWSSLSTGRLRAFVLGGYEWSEEERER